MCLQRLHGDTEPDLLGATTVSVKSVPLPCLRKSDLFSLRDGLPDKLKSSPDAGGRLR